MAKWWFCVCPLLLAVRTAAETEGKPAVPVYTNDDLDRVRRFRDETGVASVPAFPPEGDRRGSPSHGGSIRGRTEAPAARGQAYWRAEADRVAARLRTLDEQADALRQKIAAAKARASEPWSSRRQRPAVDTAAWELRLKALQDRRRQVEIDLLDRARREGALPGWLR